MSGDLALLGKDLEVGGVRREGCHAAISPLIRRGSSRSRAARSLLFCSTRLVTCSKIGPTNKSNCSLRVFEGIRIAAWPMAVGDSSVWFVAPRPITVNCDSQDEAAIPK